MNVHNSIFGFCQLKAIVMRCVFTCCVSADCNVNFMRSLSPGLLLQDDVKCYKDVETSQSIFIVVFVCLSVFRLNAISGTYGRLQNSNVLNVWCLDSQLPVIVQVWQFESARDFAMLTSNKSLHYFCDVIKSVADSVIGRDVPPRLIDCWGVAGTALVCCV